VPHRRVVFWTGLQGRLDAVRGRLLRLVAEHGYARELGFAGLGQYVRELIRLDRVLCKLPVAMRMYASGRLGRRAAWLVSRVATSGTDRAWTRFALTHTLRLLEAVVEKAELERQAAPESWRSHGGMPPSGATFAEATRMCSLLKAEPEAGRQPTARIGFFMS